MIGWEEKHREKLLHLILSNDRFLIFPWVKVPNLASKALSISLNQISDNWLATYGYRPVLVETFVDRDKYAGSCYLAANWQLVGVTKGRGRYGQSREIRERKKDIFLYSLDSNYKDILNNCHQKSSLAKKYRNDLKTSNTLSVDESFEELWSKIIDIVSKAAAEYDEKWQVRKRLIDTMMLIILIFRLVSSKNSQSYGTTIDELWDSNEKLGISLPQKSSIAPSSFCAARKKLDESVFKEINEKVIEVYGLDSPKSHTWLGHRIFAVDGMKLNLPRPLKEKGFWLPTPESHYPQGLVSCLYQLKSKVPFDFDLVNSHDERACARKHLEKLMESDIVVYDRGYFSYAMLNHHYKSGIHGIFRLSRRAINPIGDFFKSKETSKIVSIIPSGDRKDRIKEKYPDMVIVPLEVRLIKYTISDVTYVLGTTLLDKEAYPDNVFPDAYHSRWGIEELYKVSQVLIEVDDFHARSERGIRQEIFAHFTLITMNRIMANQAEENISTSLQKKPEVETNLQERKINFKNCLHVFTRNIEGLLMLGSQFRKTLKRVMVFIEGRHQKVRPNRSYERKSMRPINKWRISWRVPDAKIVQIDGAP